MTLWCRLFHARHWRIIVGQYLDGTEAAILHCTRCDQHVRVRR